MPYETHIYDINGKIENVSVKGFLTSEKYDCEAMRVSRKKKSDLMKNIQAEIDKRSYD